MSAIATMLYSEAIRSRPALYQLSHQKKVHCQQKKRNQCDHYSRGAHGLFVESYLVLKLCSVGPCSPSLLRIRSSESVMLASSSQTEFFRTSAK